MVQACFGWYHHRRYVRDKPTHRRWFTYVHLWLGRTLILCGLANCGFGLLLAGVSSHWALIWWIATGSLAGVYFFAYAIHAFLRRRRGKLAGDNFGGPRAAYELPPYAGPAGDEMKSPLIQPYAGRDVRYDLTDESRMAGRYEPTRYDRPEGYGDDYSETYDPPPPILDRPPSRPMSAGRSKQELHL